MGEAKTIELLEKLVTYPSIPTQKRYDDIAEFAFGFLRDTGAQCHWLPDPTGTRAGVLARIGPEGPGGVMLSAHLDVVPVAGQNWTSNPFRLVQRDGQFFGRGACDMKGFAAAAMACVARAAQHPLERPLMISLSYDEEIGCLGIANMIDSIEGTVGRPEYCIVGEPTLMRVVTGHKGKASYRVGFKGTPGHSAGALNNVNALHLAADFIGILRKAQSDLADGGDRDSAFDIAYSTIHAGTLHGGEALNMVPEHALLEFEIRHLANEPPEEIVQRIECEAEKLVREAADPGVGITIELDNAYPALDTEEQSDVVRFAASLGGLEPTTKVSFGTEAGFFQKAGIPTIVCGPGSIQQAHKPDEYVEAIELSACDVMLNRLIEELASN